MILLDKKNPAVYNQAIMDFGATICKPQNPLCSTCVQSKNCYAFQKGLIDKLPLRKTALRRKRRWLYYFIVEAGKDKIWIRERTEKDIWQNLYEFILWETGKKIPHYKIQESSFYQNNFANQGLGIQHISLAYNQTLTHQSITGHFVHLNKALVKIEGYQAVPRKELSEFPFPKIITEYIKILPGV